MNQQQAFRLLEAGREMRKAQKRFARTFASSDRRIRKEAEEQFDKVLKECSEGSGQLKLIP